MDIPLIIIRTIHFAGAIGLAGMFAFVVLITGAALPLLLRRFMLIGWISLAVLLLSAPLWLLLVAQGMSGDALGATLWQGAAATVLTDTQFGRVLLLRVALALALIPCIIYLGQRRCFAGLGLLLASAQLAAIAWQGHAGADTGIEAVIHLLADTAHLVAAGLWLGALLPLAMLLRAPIDGPLKHRATMRFSTLGVACVTVLLVSGVVNSWQLVGSWPALIGTPYGQALLLKLAFVAAMLVLAGINRWFLTPRLPTNTASARPDHRIARHATIEAGLGLGIIAIVAMLGTMVPGAHQPIRWPFAYRPVVAWWPPQFQLMPATPTSYALSPEVFAVSSIATGHALYAQHCASCHGGEGQGDGPMAADLPIVPLDLATSSVAAKPEGDLYWAVTAGMPGAMMPNFASLSDAQRWDIVDYLKAQRQAAAATSTLIAEATANPAPLAPDFGLPLSQGDAGTLKALLQHGDVLLVFADAPQSQTRLDQLQQWRNALGQAGVALVGITDAPDSRGVYALYEHRPQLDAEPPAAHIEFLIDRDGYIRARWRPGDAPDWTQWPILQREIAAMQRLKLMPVAPTGHVHEG
jgi:putative copper resistance protein D